MTRTTHTSSFIIAIAAFCTLATSIGNALGPQQTSPGTSAASTTAASADARWDRFTGDWRAESDGTQLVSAAIERATQEVLIVAFASTASAQIVPEPSTPAPSPSTATAPDWPQFDVSGGLSLIRMSPGPDLDRTGLAGWSGSFSFYPMRRLGVVAEIAGARRTPELEDTLVADAPVRLRQTSFLAGPTFRMLNRGRVTSRARAMVGVARLTSEFPSDLVGSGITPGQTPQDIGIFEDETAFAAAFGTAWDIRLSRALALRLNPTFMLTRFNDDTQFTQRFSTGLVVWFGPR